MQLPRPPAELDVELLEPLLRQMVELIGLTATMAIVERYGGITLNIPRQADQNEALVALIGAEKAAILGRHMGPDRLVIPKALQALQAVRNARIMEDLQCMSVRQVALSYKLHERRIWQIKAEHEGSVEVMPPGLFD